MAAKVTVHVGRAYFGGGTKKCTNTCSKTVLLRHHLGKLYQEKHRRQWLDQDIKQWSGRK